MKTTRFIKVDGKTYERTLRFGNRKQRSVYRSKPNARDLRSKDREEILEQVHDHYEK